MKLIVGADYKTKDWTEMLVNRLIGLDYEVELDFYPNSHYPLTAERTMNKFLKDPSLLPILICRTGIGMTIVANKFPGVRAVFAGCSEVVRRARWRNNCNVLCLGVLWTTIEKAVEYIRIFNNEEYEGESDYNLNLIQEIERRNMK